MRKRLILTLLIALAVCAASAEPVAMRIVSCPEQSFSTLCKPQYTYDFHPDGGLTICLGEADDQPCVTIFKTDAPGAEFDARYYLDNVYTGLLKGSYGDGLDSLSETAAYTLGGREMPARMALYHTDGGAYMRFCAFDLRDDCFVRYEAFSPQEDIAIEDALQALSDAVRYFQPDAGHYGDAGTPMTDD